MTISSPVSIYNLALSHLGIDSVSNIEDPVTRIEKIGNQYYDIARQTLYRDGYFQFSIIQLVVPEDTVTPHFLYSHQSAELPKDLINLMYIYRDDTILTNNGKNYRLYNNRIQSELAGPYSVVYVKDVTDVNSMAPEYKLLLSFYLASLTAESLGASPDKKAFVTANYDRLLEKAKSNNAQDNAPVTVNDSGYIDSYQFLNGLYGSRGFN